MICLIFCSKNFMGFMLNFGIGVLRVLKQKLKTMGFKPNCYVEFHGVVSNYYHRLSRVFLRGSSGLWALTFVVWGVQLKHSHKRVKSHEKFIEKPNSSPKSEKVRMSKEWANDLLRYGIKVLKEWWVSPNSHKDSVVYKILIVSGFIGQLENEGYWWQAKRLANHLHRYLSNLQPKADTLSEREERGFIHGGCSP
jgi:hypothetical protein